MIPYALDFGALALEQVTQVGGPILAVRRDVMLERTVLQPCQLSENKLVLLIAEPVLDRPPGQRPFQRGRTQPAELTIRFEKLQQQRLPKAQPLLADQVEIALQFR